MKQKNKYCQFTKNDDDDDDDHRRVCSTKFLQTTDVCDIQRFDNFLYIHFIYLRLMTPLTTTTTTATATATTYGPATSMAYIRSILL